MCQGLEYGPKSDIWAAGCVIYEMMSLRKPFDAENLPALVARIIAVHIFPYSIYNLNFIFQYLQGVGQVITQKIKFLFIIM
jgi:serine/threonine protein kinase